MQSSIRGGCSVELWLVLQQMNSFSGINGQTLTSLPDRGFVRQCFSHHLCVFIPLRTEDSTRKVNHERISVQIRFVECFALLFLKLIFNDVLQFLLPNSKVLLWISCKAINPFSKTKKQCWVLVFCINLRTV